MFDVFPTSSISAISVVQLSASCRALDVALSFVLIVSNFIK